jgi:CheY-like chemotaxis protein
MARMTNRPNVLVVEDEAKLARAIALYLRPRGYDVRTAANGAEALTLIAEDRPDVIVSDIMMPVMDGYTLCRRLREDPAARAIPFLFLTAKDDEMERIRGLKLGADDYVAKPCDLEEIKRRVQTLLGRVAAARRIASHGVQMSGDLEETELVDLVQALGLHEKTGALILKRHSESGVLYLKDGQIIGAELGTSDGREPLASLLAWKSGTYFFVSTADPDAVRLTSGIANVVMDHVEQ